MKSNAPDDRQKTFGSIKAIVPVAWKDALKRRLTRILHPGRPPYGHRERRRLFQGRPGVNILGYFHSSIGITESAQACLRAAKAAGIPCEGSALPTERARRRGDLPYATNIIHANAAETPSFGGAAPELFEDRFNIGCWHWELSTFPAEFDEAFQYVHEVWVPSSFAQRAIAQRSPVPVVMMPHSIEVPLPSMEARRRLGLPEGRFLVLSMFDMHSYFARKNPLAAIEAFCRAFRPDDKATLVVKVQHADADPPARESLLRQIDAAGAILIEAVLSREDTWALVGACDAYVSLHRSEGFGLIIAEAMAMGKPVVATGYSGNMDFMRPWNSYPVDYRLVEIEQDIGPYPAGCVWADPDVEQAAELLRGILDDRDAAREVGRRAREDISRELSPMRIGTLYRQRLVRLGMLALSP